MSTRAVCIYSKPHADEAGDDGEVIRGAVAVAALELGSGVRPIDEVGVVAVLPLVETLTVARGVYTHQAVVRAFFLRDDAVGQQPRRGQPAGREGSGDGKV